MAELIIKMSAKLVLIIISRRDLTWNYIYYKTGLVLDRRCMYETVSDERVTTRILLSFIFQTALVLVFSTGDSFKIMLYIIYNTRTSLFQVKIVEHDALEFLSDSTSHNYIIEYNTCIYNITRTNFRFNLSKENVIDWIYFLSSMRFE